MDWGAFTNLDQVAFADARAQAKSAADFVSQIARRFATPNDDYRHHALKWEPKTKLFTTQELKNGLELTLKVATLQVGLSEKGKTVSAVNLGDSTRHGRQLSLLEDCFDAAAAAIRSETVRLRHHQPSPVLCWPHHFDIATLVTFDQKRDGERVSIGIGMSPGDDHYPAPYFYINPWPYPAGEQLAPAPPPYKWHTTGFTSLIYDTAKHGAVTNLATTLKTGVDTVAETLQLAI